MRWLWVLGLVAACERHRVWIETHATQLHVEGFVANIPAGWRDAHELADPWPVKLPPGTRTILREDAPHSAVIDVFSLPLAVHDDCSDLAKLWQSSWSQGEESIGEVENATFDGDHGCLMHLMLGGHPGRLVLRSHGNHTAAVRCFGSVDTSQCTEIAYALTPDPR